MVAPARFGEHVELRRAHDAPALLRPDRGQRTAEIAAAHVERCGLIVLARNFRCRAGEIDLICRDGEFLVFVEVRLRSRRDFGGALASVGPQKRRRIVRAAQFYVLTEPRRRNHRLRFDVVALQGGREGEVRLEWIKDAFRGG